MTPRLLYSLFMVLALAVFVLARARLSKPAAVAALATWQRLALALAAFAGGALGAKLPFAFAGADGWLSSATWLADGKTVTTGLAGAYLAVELAKRALGLRVKTGDTFALPLALALAVGRWGCFWNGCCYGVATDLPWAVDFGDGVLRHPTQVYESLFHLGMALVLWRYRTAEAWRYQQLKFYLLAYCVYRFATEWIRPEPAGMLGLTFYQWVCLVLAGALSIQALCDERRKRAENRPAAD